MNNETCENCGNCYDERGKEVPKWYCTITGAEKQPDERCDVYKCKRGEVDDTRTENAATPKKC